MFTYSCNKDKVTILRWTEVEWMDNAKQSTYVCMTNIRLNIGNWKAISNSYCTSLTLRHIM